MRVVGVAEPDPSAQREPQQAGVGDRVAKLRVAEQLRSREALAVVQQEPLPTSQTSTKLPLATLVRAGWWARRRKKRPATGKRPSVGNGQR